MTEPEPRPATILRGIVRLARGQPDGLLCFSGTNRSVLSSLVPLAALPVIGFLLNCNAAVQDRTIDLMAAICVLLTAPVLSHALAKRLGREALWSRYVVASNWCQWAFPAMAALLSATLGAGVLALGATPYQASTAVVAVLLPYAIWLQWFVARHGLALNGPVAAALVVGVDVGVLAVVAVPLLAAAHGVSLTE